MPNIGVAMFRSVFLTSAAGAVFLVTALPAVAEDGIEDVTVTAERLNQARNGIQTQTGASTYTITANDIQSQPGGDNLALNSVVLQAPGVAQDSFGQLHVRAEHNGLQYRLNGIILPEGITAFSQTLDPRLAKSVRLITGALPAEYGLRTAGIIDIQTKTGLFNNGGTASIYGGSHSTLTPSIAYGGSSGRLNFFVSGDYTTNTLGMESPDGSSNPAHDRTQQYHGFAYLSDIVDQNTSVSAVLGTSSAIFEIPNRRGLQPVGLDGIVGLGPQDSYSGNHVLDANGNTTFPSLRLDERQREITHYTILSYLHAHGDMDTQVSLFGRYSSLFFTPGSNVGPLLYDGIAQKAYKRDAAYGLQAESAWHGWERHTVRFGALYQADDTLSQTSSLVLATAPGGPNSNGIPNLNPNPLCTDPALTCQTSATPLTIADNGSKHGYNYGFYLQDEWALTDTLTVNYGLRYDAFTAYEAENQLSPRVNAVWKPIEGTTIHAGYARYFSPPPFELVASSDVALFDNTTAAGGGPSDTPRAERADYYDIGVEQRLFDRWTIGLDGFYKASSNLIDEGQFGAPIILTPFNYKSGRQYGGEFTLSYQNGNFSGYVNASYERAVGRDIVSSQFQFDPGDLAYIASHYIPLDHQQIGTASAGANYKWEDMTFSTSLLYGTGLRRDGTTPNGDHVPSYVTVNFGASRDFKVGDQGFSARVDLINAFDEKYEIRDGTGVGVGAPQFGARRAIFVGLSKAL
jgi:outer membrane receptor protein involved in Fe transport